MPLVSPDERQEWLLEQLERRMERVEYRVDLELADHAVQNRRLDEHGERFVVNETAHKEIWQEISGLRKLLLGFLVSVAVGAVGVAIAIAVNAGGATP